MDKKRKKAGIIIMLALLIVAIGGVMFWKYFYIKKQVKFSTVDDVFYNPLMGFAVKASNEDAVGDNTMVYVDITWREWEPDQGEYAIEAVMEDNLWYRWKAEGKNVVLRFICDKPDDEEHMDIPDWLYEQTLDGMFYDMDYGKGYAPDYSNQLFIEAHRTAILKLGEVFGQDNMVSYIELGSLGHWGEWHMNYTKGTTRMPKESVRKQYVTPYVEAFPNALILARRPFPETAELGMGVFNDMIGAPEDTLEWLEWIAVGGSYGQPIVEEELTPQPEIWLQSPIGGEFTSSLSWDEMLDDELIRTLDLIRQSHTTFIGPKCPVLDELEQYKKGVSEVLKTIGYRYGVSSVKLNYWKMSDSGKLTLTINNNGIAPIYFPWKMWLYILNEDNEIVQKILIPVDLTKLCGGESLEVFMEDVPIKEGNSYAIGIENPDTGEPSVSLDMNSPSKDKCYVLFTLQN